MPKESTVGAKLTDLTTKKSMMLMLSVILLYPFFLYETYWSDQVAYQTAINILHKNGNDNLVMDLAFVKI